MRDLIKTVKGIPSFPSWYTKLEYIQSTGTQYINTNLTFPNGFSFEMDASTVFNPASCMLWTWNGTNRNFIYTAYASYKNILQVASGAGWANYVATTERKLYVGSNEVSPATLSIDGVAQTMQSNDGTPYYNDLSFYLFARNSSGTANLFSKTKLYSLKLYSNGIIKANYVPARRDSDSKVWLYDMVSNSFFSSNSASEFVGG